MEVRDIGKSATSKMDVSNYVAVVATLAVYGFGIELPAGKGTSSAQHHHQHPRLAKSTATEAVLLFTRKPRPDEMLARVPAYRRV